MRPAPVVPAHGGACVDAIVPALLGPRRLMPGWLPQPLHDAEQVVLLVLDGLGWEQLRERSHLCPTLCSMAGGAITSVAPTTTAAALASITTGTPPAEHGVVGYRVHVGSGSVMNVLRWRTEAGDAREAVPPATFQPVPAFAGTSTPAVIRSEFLTTGFTGAIFAGARLVGWRVPSTMVVETARLVRAGEPLVYAYYDGVDRVAHEFGLGPHYDAELRATDRLVGDLVEALPAGTVLAITSDHGQVEVGDAVVPLAEDVMADVSLLSGEGRFRWLHARPGRTGALEERARDHYDDLAWVHPKDELVAAGWFGGRLSPAADARLGDVALVPFEPVAFLDPRDTGEITLVSRHGSLTTAEMLVPLLATAA